MVLFCSAHEEHRQGFANAQQLEDDVCAVFSLKLSSRVRQPSIHGLAKRERDVLRNPHYGCDKLVGSAKQENQTLLSHVRRWEFAKPIQIRRPGFAEGGLSCLDIYKPSVLEPGPCRLYEHGKLNCVPTLLADRTAVWHIVCYVLLLLEDTRCRQCTSRTDYSGSATTMKQSIKKAEQQAT